jgi:pyruvate/2-oxoglutarate dehydrogenase complex dihydrolipoamide dehydrogenase (E3) component
MSTTSFIAPDDAHNRALVERTHPKDWPVHAGEDRYDMVIIGGGPAGLVTAMGANGVGARVAIIEKGLLGGDCLISGCVPSKALLKSAKVARSARKAASFGVHTGEVEVDFPAVMERMRSLRADISHHDAAERFQKEGIDVFLGRGTFVGQDAIEVNGRRLTFKRAVIATGAHARRPNLPGVDDANVLDNESLFALTELPRRLVVVGGGVIGCEMAQAFAAFGSQVTLIELGDRVLPRVAADASHVLEAALRSEGVTLIHNAAVTSFERVGDDRIVVASVDGEDIRVAADAVLVSIGRVPNMNGLGLDVAGVDVHKRGIDVDDFMRTSNSRVFAVGDVASKYQFTHAADAMARMVVRNALFFGRKRHSALVVPSCTFTEPEIATVGQTEAGADHQVFRANAADLDRTVVDGHARGFLEVVSDGSGTILGATAVGERAGELINTVALAMTQGVSLSAISEQIFAYPTESELIKRTGDAFNRTRLSATAAKVLKAIIGLRR